MNPKFSVLKVVRSNEVLWSTKLRKCECRLFCRNCIYLRYAKQWNKWCCWSTV